MRTLLAVDDSKESFDAAAFAHRILRPEDEIIVLNVAWGGNPVGFYTMGGLAAAPAPAVYDDNWDALRDNAWRVVQEAGEAAEAEVGRVELGDPGQRICDVAVEEGAELIILGSRDRGWLERIFSPSVSGYVVSHAPCPVLVVR